MKMKIFMLAALITSSRLVAQTDSTRTLDEIIVTANKNPQKQSTTGKVISVISKEQIEKSAGKGLGQILNEQAGLIINGSLNNTGTNQAVYMRGSSSGRTLILLDGIPVYDPSLINNEFDLNLIPLNSVERIEICRGAQSTLYGSDAIAGVINIITIPVDIVKPVNMKATAMAGNRSTFRGNLQWYGQTGNLAYDLRYARSSTKGFSSAFDSTGEAGFDNDGFTSDALNASLRYRIVPGLSLRGFVQYSHFDSDIDAGAFADEKDWTNESRNLLAGSVLRFQKNKIILQATYQYSDIHRLSINDSLDKPGFTIFSKDNYYGRAQYVEAYANFDLGQGFSFLQGADYRYSSMINHFFSESSFGPYTAPPIDSTQHQASLFTSVYFHAPGGKLNIELGGRLNSHSRYGGNSTYTFNPSYSINDHYRVFGSMATGFKAPTVYQLYSTYGDPGLKPEKSTNYEVGLQQDHGKIRNRIVWFHRIIKDGLDFNNVMFRYFNFNEQTVNGLEWENSLRLIKGLDITINYTYLDPTEQSQSRKTFNDTTYAYLLKRSNHSLNVLAGYRFNEGPYISLSLKYTGKRFDTGGYQASDEELDPYLLLGAYGEYRFKKYFKIFADLQNITNKKFFDIRGYNSIPFLVSSGITFTW